MNKLPVDPPVHTRSRIPRFHLRTLLILIAIFAVLLSAVIQTGRRAWYCRERAQFHMAQSASHKQTALVATYKVRLLQSDVMFVESNKFTESVLQASRATNPETPPEEKDEILKGVKAEMVAESKKEIEQAALTEQRHRALAARHAELADEFQRAMWKPWVRLPGDNIKDDDLPRTDTVR